MFTKQKRNYKLTLNQKRKQAFSGFIIFQYLLLYYTFEIKVLIKAVYKKEERFNNS